MAFKEHEMIHTQETPYSCSICNRKFTRPRDALRHEKIHGKYSCRICDQKFDKSSDVKTHERTHTSKLFLFKKLYQNQCSR